MDASSAKALHSLEKLAVAVASLPQIAGEAYANGGYASEPIVGRHFTAGKQQCYGFPPLSRQYFITKQDRIANRRGNVTRLGKGKKGVRIDPSAGFRSTTGTMNGEGTGRNLPMLVLGGDLRQAITARNHRVVVNGNTTVITFVNLPTYAQYLHDGTARMPSRALASASGSAGCSTVSPAWCCRPWRRAASAVKYVRNSGSHR